MELVLKSDLNTWAPFDNATDAVFFNPVRTQLVDSIGALISDEALTAILAFTRDDETDKTKELYQFWLTFVLPYSALAVFVQMLSTHGFIFSTNGIIQFADRENTSASVSDKNRGMFIRQYESQRESYKIAMLRRFSDVDGIFDGVEYEVDVSKYDTYRYAPIFNAIGKINTENNLRTKFRL